MVWWGWLILGASVILVVGGVLAALRSRKKGDGVDRLGLAENTATTLQEENKIEAAADQQIAVVEGTLQERVERIHKQHQEELQQSRQETDREKETLTDDTDALDRKLDSLLGVGSKGKDNHQS